MLLYYVYTVQLSIQYTNNLVQASLPYSVKPPMKASVGRETTGFDFIGKSNYHMIALQYTQGIKSMHFSRV